MNRTHDEFRVELNNLSPNILIIGTYTKATSHIRVKCAKCGGEWSPTSQSLLRGSGCPYCCPTPRAVLRGFNDMWTTNPQLASLLLDLRDGYMYTQNSGKRVDWKCPECNQVIKNRQINDIASRNRLSCPKCGDGISYPEKFLVATLNQLQISFEKEKTFSWAKGKRYDFYIQHLDMVIEVNGVQHYTKGFAGISKNARDLNAQRGNDLEKYSLAMDNTIRNYVILDASLSTMEFIRNSILTSLLWNYLNLDSVDWLQCHESACNNLVKIACGHWNNGIKNTKDIAQIMNYSHATIGKYLKVGAELNWCNYNPKEASKLAVRDFTSTCRKVRCVETNRIYDSLSDAARDVINGSNSHISTCCKGKRKTCGISDDGTKLHWEYVV